MERKIDKKKNSGTGIAQDASEVEKVKNYIYTYLKSADFTARTCKTAYIRDEHHERIQQYCPYYREEQDYVIRLHRQCTGRAFRKPQG